MNQFTNHQADFNKLVSKLRIRILPKYRKLSQPDGPEGRLRNLRQTVTALIKYERIELSYSRADEARGYAERLISEAIRHGDVHKPTMEMASYWLYEKQLVHKLFKVLVPRFSEYQMSYTALFKAPLNFPTSLKSRSVLELKGNPFPPLIFDGSRNKNLIHNILLEEAYKERKRQEYAEIVNKVSTSEKQKNLNNDFGKESLSKAVQDVSEGEALLKSVEINLNEQCTENLPLKLH